jgi:chromosome segregation ATPase
MADHGDETPVGPSTPDIVVTPAEGSNNNNNENTESSKDHLQASHDTKDDAVLPKVRSESQADTNPESEEKPLVSPEDDEFKDNGESRPVSPVNDDEDEQSVTSSHFSDSDSDEDTRGRARRSSRDRDMSPDVTFTTRFVDQTEIAKANAERRRSQEGVVKGARRQATKSRSPLAIKSITRDGDNVIVVSPTYGTITITDPKVAEELDKSFADGQVTLSPVKRALSLSQDVQDAIEQAFQEQEIVRLAAAYKNGSKSTPPPVPERPGSPQFGQSSADAEAQHEDNNPASQQGGAPGLRAPAETGSLGHRRSASVDIARQALQQSRYDLIHHDLRRLAVDPYHNVNRWDRDALWGFMRTQDNRVLSIAEVLHKNSLKTEVEGMIDLQEERKFARTEVERIKSEYDRQTIVHEQRNAELETELASAEAEIEGLRAAQALESTREAIYSSRSDSLSPESKEGLKTVDKHFEKLNTMHETASKGMNDLRSQLDIAQELRNENEELRTKNQQLRDNLSRLHHQTVFFEKQADKAESRFEEQKQTIDKLNKAYTALDKENIQLKVRIQDSQDANHETEVENAELKAQLENSQNAQVQLAKDKSNLKPVEESSTAIKVGTEPKTLGDSSPTLSGKIAALEKVIVAVREESDRYRELYLAANEQRVWSFAHYATVKEPWPVPTRDLIAQMIVSMINDNRKPIQESVDPADVALNGRSTRDIQFELTGLVEDLPLSGTLTRNQVVQWFAAGLGIRAIFDEIRSLDLYLDKDIEQEILRVLIEQGWCYGNFDVFATFVFSDRLVSREEFVRRLNDIMSVLDRLDKDLVKTETDLDLALDRVAELEQRDYEQSMTITNQAHELNKVENAWDAMEADRGNLEGTLGELIELQGEHEDLKARHAMVSDQMAYYEAELAETRQDLDSAEDALDNAAEQQSCTVLPHRELEARVQDLEKQKRELAARFSKHMAESKATPDTQNELPSAPHDYWAELTRLRRENDEYLRDMEMEGAHVPNSPACPHCSSMKRQIIGLKRRLREAKRDATPLSPLSSPSGQSANAPEQSPSGSPSNQSADAPEQSPPNCDDCLYLTMKLRKAKQQSKDFEDKLRVKKDQIRGCHYEIDKTRDELAEANKEIERLKSDDVFSSPKSTSTGPTSAGSTPDRSSETKEFKRLKELCDAQQQTLADGISQRLDGNWGATKLAAPPADREQELFDSFDTEGNARKLASEKAQLEKQVATLQKNLDDFEVTSSQLENTDVRVSLARIENLKRQVEQIPDLETQISTLTEEKKKLITMNNYLTGKDSPSCCGVTKTQLQKEIEAHAITKKELDDAVDAAATEDDSDDSDDSDEEDPCADVKQELQNVKQELFQSKGTMSREYNDLIVEFAFSQKQLLEARRRNKVESSELRPDEDPRAVDETDPCKDVKDELAALKLEHADALDVIKDVSAENENTKKLLRQARIDLNKAGSTVSGTKKIDDKKVDEKEDDNEKVEKKTFAQKKAEVLQKRAEDQTAREHNNGCTRHDDLIRQIKELEGQIAKTRDHQLAEDKTEKLTQKLRGSAVTIEELRFEVGKLEATSKAYRLAGDRHGPPANDNECKDAINELIGEQTKLKDLIDNYNLKAPAKKSEPVEEKKEEPEPKPKGLVKNTFDVVKSFVLWKEAPIIKPVVDVPKKKEQTPAPKPEPEPESESETDLEDDPCSIYKKHLKDVKKQVDAFEMLTLFKEKFLKEQEIVERKDKENMQLKNKLELILKDAPTSLRKRLTEAVEANRKQANIIGCNEIVAAQQLKEMTALRKELEVLRKPNGPLNDLVDKNYKLQKTIDKVQGKFLASQLKNSKDLNFLGREISILYAERDKWRGSERPLTEGLWKPADAAKNGSDEASTSGSPKAAEAKTGDALVKTGGSPSKTGESPTKTAESPTKTTESAPKVAESTSKPTESATKTTESKLGEDFRGTPENPWPRITYDCWPQPSDRLQKLYQKTNAEMEYMYNKPKYVSKDRGPSHPKADMTRLWNEVQNTRWKLAEPQKLGWYPTVSKKFTECIENEYFLPGFWLIIFLLDYFGHDHYTVPTLDFIFGHENDNKDLAAGWTPFIIIFFGLYTWWLQYFLRSVYGRKESVEAVVSDIPPSSDKEDSCANVKKELEDVKAELVKAKEAGKDNSKKEDSKKDNEDSGKDLRSELAIKAAKFDDLQAQSNGDKSVIDWKNDKRSNSVWQRVKDTRFWEVAGIPGPTPVDAVTYDEFQRNGGLGASNPWMGQSSYYNRVPTGMRSAVEYWSSPGSGSGSGSASVTGFAPPPYEWTEDPNTSIYAPDKATMTTVWQEYMKRHPDMQRYVAGFYPWTKEPATRESVNMSLSPSQRRAFANAYGAVFPGREELTAWRASQRLLPPSDQEIAAISAHHLGGSPQISAALIPDGPLAAPTTSNPVPEKAKVPGPFSHIPEHLRHFKAKVPAKPVVAPVSDPCKDVKDKLAKSQKDLGFWKHRQWKGEPAEVQKRCKEWYDEWRAKTILYDPVRERLTAIEAELEKDKKELKEAKEQLVLADPKTIKTNKQQKADAVAQQKKLDAAQKEADKKVEEAEKQAEQSKKRADEFRRALEIEKEARLNASTDEDEEVARPVDQMSWLRFWITLGLSIYLALKYFRLTTLNSLPMYQDSALSVTEILWYDTFESTRDHHALIVILGLITLAVLLFLGAFLASADRGVNPYPDFDDSDDGNDGSNDGDDKDDDSKGDSSNSKKPGSGNKKNSSPKVAKPKGPLSFLMTGLPSSPLSPTFKRAGKNYNHKNPLSWFPHGIAPATPTSPKSPKSPVPFKTTRHETWKHSYISSVSTEPSAGTSATTTPKEVKDLEDRLGKMQQKLTMVERELLAAKIKEQALTQPATDVRPQGGPHADQYRRRQSFKYSTIGSVSTVPPAVKEAAKTVASSTIQTTDNSAGDKDLKAELVSVKKQLEDAKKEIAAKKSWDTTDKSNEDWLDPRKTQNEELLKQARDEIEWLRKQKAKEDKKKDGFDDDGEDDDEDDEDGPPPGSIELKFIIAEDMLKIRERQLKKADDDLKVCHNANKVLRNKFYDQANGWEAERKKVEELKKAKGLIETSENGTQTSPTTDEASSGDVDHSECNKKFRDFEDKIKSLRKTLREEREEADADRLDAESQLRQLKEQGSTQDNTAKQDLIDKLNKEIQDLEKDFDRVVKQLEHYKSMYNSGADHGACLRGGKRTIIEQRIADFENNRDKHIDELEEKIRELEAEIKNLNEVIKNIRNNKRSLQDDADNRGIMAEKAKHEARTLANELRDERRNKEYYVARLQAGLKEMEALKKQLSDCEEAKGQLKEAQDVEGNVESARQEAADAKKELADWLERIELNKTHVLQDESSDPEVAKYQQEVFEKNALLDLALYQKKEVERNLKFYKDLLLKTQEAEDHTRCKAKEKLYQQQAEAAEKARDEAAHTNANMWLTVLAEQTKARDTNEAKEAAETKAQEAEKEKEEIVKQLEDKTEVSPPEHTDNTEEPSSPEITDNAEVSPSPGMYTTTS